MSRFISYVLLWLVLSEYPAGFLHAQQLFFKSYTVEDGLVSNNIREVFQDSEGFMWVATWDGLSKYDGHKFTNFNRNNGLSFNLVNDLYETVDGKIVVALNNGDVDVIEHGAIRENTTWNNIIINKFLASASGEVVVPTDYNGIWEFRDGKLTKPKQTLPQATYYFLSQWGDSLWVGGDHRMLRVLNNRYELLTELTDTTTKSYFYCFYQDSQKRLWVGTHYHGMKLLDPLQKNREVTFAPLPPPFNIDLLANLPVSSIYEDWDGNFWIGTAEGLLKVQPNSHYRLYTQRDGLPGNQISRIFQDREGNIWIGTTQGLAKLVTKNNVRLYTTQDGLMANSVYNLYLEDNKTLLLNTDKGLWRYNISSRQFTPLLVTSRQIIFQRNKVPLLRYGEKTAIYNTTDGTITMTPLPLLVDAVTDAHGNIIGLPAPVSNEVAFLTGEGKLSSISFPIQHRIHKLLIDKNGYLWVGTWNMGLYRVSYTLEQNWVATTIKDYSHLIPGKEIRTLYEDRKGNIWVGTRYNGVVCLKKRGQDVYMASGWDHKQVLTNNWITAIAEDEAGNIWLGSPAGLDKLIVEHEGSRVFNFSKITHLFTQVFAIVPDSGNGLWLGTSSGLIHITDDRMEAFPAAQPVITTAVLGAGQEGLDLSSNRRAASLAHTQNHINFEFSSPGFINEKQILYSYRLLSTADADTTWSKPANVHTVAYASLQPGNYHFEVKTIGWDGNPGNPVVFDFTIHPPWWQTWWFRIPLFGAIIGLITFLVRRRIKNIRFKAEMKHKIAETEMMALRAQMNPHFIFNCINSIDAFIQSNDKYQATVYLNKFAKLLRNVLDSSRQNTVTLSKDLEALQLYVDLEQLRDENKFTASIKADKSLLEDDYKVPPLVVQPFVENAILHGLKNKPGTDGKLCITVSKHSEHIKYVIEDNGVGRKTFKSINLKRNNSYGMQMSSERVKLFNEEEEENTSVVVTDLEENGTPAGTRVQVLLKMR